MNDIKDTLKRRYVYRTELHAHSAPASQCGKVPPEELARMYCELGYNAVVLTNHFLYDPTRCASEYVEQYLDDYYRMEAAGGLKVLLGAEIRFTESLNDYLVYGVDKELLTEIYDRLPYGVCQFRQEFAMPHSLFVQAHPFRDNVTRAEPSLLDGVEAYNMHPKHNSRIGLAARWASENHVGVITAGSDFHNPVDCGCGLAALRTHSLPTDSYALAAMLKEGDYVLEVGGNIIIP